MTPCVTLRPFTRGDLGIVAPWFEDGLTQRFLGGPGWPAQMLECGERSIGEAFRGAIQTGAYRYLAHVDRQAVGYADCGTFDRCTVYGGEGPAGPIIIESINVATGSIAFVTDPQVRGRGVGRAMLGAMICRSELRFVELFEAGVERENTGSRICLEAAGFRLRSAEPDVEGMLYYCARRTNSTGAPNPPS